MKFIAAGSGTKVARAIGVVKSTHRPDFAADDHDPAELL
jgi:hypothetical protein